MAIGGHPDFGIGDSASQGSSGTGMESAFGGAAIGIPGGAPAGGNEMASFLDMMSQQYGTQSVKNFVDNYLNRKIMDAEIIARGGFMPGAPGGRRAFGGMPSSSAQSFGIQDNPVFGMENFEGQTSMLDMGVPSGAMANPSPAQPTLEMDGRLTPAQLAELDKLMQDSAYFANPSVLSDTIKVTADPNDYKEGNIPRRPFAPGEGV